MSDDKEREHCEAVANSFAEDNVGGWRPGAVVFSRTALSDLIQRERAAAIRERDAMRQALLPEDERHVLNDRDACVNCGQLCIVGERCPATTEVYKQARAAAREQALEEALALCTTSKPLGPGMHELPHREDIERDIRALKVPR